MPIGEEVSLKTADARARNIEEGPREAASWHHHNEVTEGLVTLT